MSDVKQDFIFHNELPQDSLMIIKTLNHEHGSIQHYFQQAINLSI